MQRCEKSRSHTLRFKVRHMSLLVGRTKLSVELVSELRLMLCNILIALGHSQFCPVKLSLESVSRVSD